jgi:hypothetical protein
MTSPDRTAHMARIAPLGALAAHLGTTPEQRRARTAAARAARAAKRGPAKPPKPTMADKIAAAEAALAEMPADERARQEAWIEQAKAALRSLELAEAHAS